MINKEKSTPRKPRRRYSSTDSDLAILGEGILGGAMKKGMTQRSVKMSGPTWILSPAVSKLLVESDIPFLKELSYSLDLSVDKEFKSVVISEGIRFLLVRFSDVIFLHQRDEMLTDMGINLVEKISKLLGGTK